MFNDTFAINATTASHTDFLNRDLETGLFSAFAFFGVLGVALVSPATKLTQWCWCYIRLPGSMKTAGLIYIVYLVNVWFVCTYAMLTIFFELQARLWDLGLHDSSFYGIGLGLGAILVLFALARFTRLWLIVFHILVTNMVATMIYNCETSMCFAIRSAIVLALVSVLATMLMCCTFAGKISDLLTEEQVAIVGPFAAVFALANATNGLEYWLDEENPWYLLVIALGITIFKQSAQCIARRLVCCTHWTELVDEDLVLMDKEPDDDD